jgi:hypothetical protein
MAQLTMDELESQIRFRGDYQNVRKFPKKDLQNEIQKAFQTFWQLVADTHQGWWDKEQQITTTANTAFVAMPSDCWRVLAIDRNDGGEWVEMAQISIDQRNRYGIQTGKPLSYWLSSRGAEMRPVPDTTIYTLRVMYTPKAPSLAASQPREWYNGWDEYVMESVLLVLERREKLPTTDREAALAAAKDKLVAGASNRRQQEPEYLRLREFDDFDPFKDGLW